jgi:DNA invertase Pin-like site-specific DNA recombinase
VISPRTWWVEAVRRARRLSECEATALQEGTLTAERAAHARAVAEAAGRRVGRPVAQHADKIEYARLLKDQGSSYGEISTKTGIPKSSLHRYLQE